MTLLQADEIAAGSLWGKVGGKTGAGAKAGAKGEELRQQSTTDSVCIIFVFHCIALFGSVLYCIPLYGIPLHRCIASYCIPCIVLLSKRGGIRPED